MVGGDLLHLGTVKSSVMNVYGIWGHTYNINFLFSSLSLSFDIAPCLHIHRFIPLSHVSVWGSLSGGFAKIRNLNTVFCFFALFCDWALTVG